jgi:hypothetical protein
MAETDDDMSARRRAETAALVAEHHARVAVLPPYTAVAPPLASPAAIARINRDNVAHALGVQASCAAYAKAVAEMHERHRAEPVPDVPVEPIEPAEAPHAAQEA